MLNARGLDINWGLLFTSRGGKSVCPAVRTMEDRVVPDMSRTRHPEKYNKNIKPQILGLKSTVKYREKLGKQQ